MIGMTINMDVSKLSLQAMMNAFLTKGGSLDMAVKAGLESVLPGIKNRIHEEGKAADGSDIGYYSVKPIYVNPGNAPGRFSTIGKTGRSVFKGGKKKGQEHRTGYFGGGYNAFKTTIGRNPAGKVNLWLTGALMDDLVLIETEKGWALGWLNDEMPQRAQALENKYAKQIWRLSESELNELMKSIGNAEMER